MQHNLWSCILFILFYEFVDTVTTKKEEEEQNQNRTFLNLLTETFLPDLFFTTNVLRCSAD